jgi:hypothetical protein
MSAFIPAIEWLAPAATMIAAIMTAANLGARITGWGFVIFLVASLAWTALGLAGGQQSLIYANAFLVIVNAVGIWRWLGRQTSYEDGAAKAAQKSVHEHVPTLFSFGGLIGAAVTDKQGNAAGTIVDLMGKCDSGEIAYFVISEGGVGGVGERLHAIPASCFELGDDEVILTMDGNDVQNLDCLQTGAWPTEL